MNNTNDEKKLANLNSEKKTRFMQRYGTIAIWLFPIYTFLIARTESLVQSNLSKIGNMPGNYTHFLIWGSVGTVFLSSTFSYLFLCFTSNRKKDCGICYCASLFLLITVMLPFAPEKHPFLSALHCRFAELSALLTFICTAIINKRMKMYDDVYRKLKAITGITVLLCSLLVAMTAISGLVEVVFIAGTCVHMSVSLNWYHAKGQPSHVKQFDESPALS